MRLFFTDAHKNRQGDASRAPLPGLKRKYMNEMIYLFRIRSRSSSSCIRRFSFSAALSKK